MPIPEQILVVEDEPDIAEMLAEIVRQEGYGVTVAPNAAAGLAALRSRRFALVLSDHSMPGQTGVAMLREAEAAGLLEGTSVLLFSAESPGELGPGWRALRKPVEFDVLIEEVHRGVIARSPGPISPVTPSSKGAVMPLLELVLYVTAASASSSRAQRNLERALARYDAAAISLAVVDLSDPRSEPDPEDRVAFTPMLVKRSPTPRAWLVGDLRDLKALRSLLEDANVNRGAT